MNDDQDHKGDDKQLFRELMGDVQPLIHDKVEPVRKRPRPIPRKHEEDERQVLIDMMSDEMDIDEVDAGEELLFVRPGIQHKSFRKLRLGHFSTESELDLHGMSVEMARITLARYLLECQERERRCIRIIHGKGLGSATHRGPVLKNMVNKWLRQRKEVLAFCSALPRDGGTGAVYVLLKRG